MRKDGAMKARPTSVAPPTSPLEVANSDRRLRGQGPRHNLGERKRKVISLLVDALTVLDQVPAHIAHQRRRPAETDSAELRESRINCPRLRDGANDAGVLGRG